MRTVCPEHTSAELPVFTRAPPRRFNCHSRTIGFILHQSLYASLVLARNVYKELIVADAMFASGAAVFSYYDHPEPINATLASVSTITTIGLYTPNGGNFRTLNGTEASLLIALIIVSVGAAASLLQGTVSSVVNGDLARGAAERRLIKRMKGHVIVFGYAHGDTPWDPFGDVSKLSRIPLDGLLVVEVNGEYAGFLYWFEGKRPYFDRNVDRYANFQELHILDRFRRRGLARALIERFLADARKRGIIDAFLDTDDDNILAQHLYESLGFTHYRKEFHYRMRLGGSTSSPSPK